MCFIGCHKARGAHADGKLQAEQTHFSQVRPGFGYEGSSDVAKHGDEVHEFLASTEGDQHTQCHEAAVGM
jgi:hypothetical protein